MKSADAHRLETLRFKLTQCLDRRVKNKHRHFAHRFYEQGNKGGKLLARQLKKQEDSRHVHTLTAHNKQIVDTQTIAAEFHHFYRSLYNIGSILVGAADGCRVGKFQEYLKVSDLSVILSAVLEEMERLISSEELGTVIVHA